MCRPTHLFSVLFFCFSRHSTFCQSKSRRWSRFWEEAKRQTAQTWTSRFNLGSFQRCQKFQSSKNLNQKPLLSSLISSPGSFFLMFILLRPITWIDWTRLFPKFVSPSAVLLRSVALTTGCRGPSLNRPHPRRIPTSYPIPHPEVTHVDFHNESVKSATELWL